MKVKSLLLLVGLALGLMTFTSSTCNKEEDPADPGTCTGYVSAASSGIVTSNYCFDEITSYNYQPNSYTSLWAHENSTDLGFDLRLNSDNGAPLTPGTYNCGPGELGFVELIYENPNDVDNEFYKSQSGTLTFTLVNETNMEGSFDVVCVGYYNGESINFTGTFSK